MLHDEQLRSTPVIDRDHERALAGACLLDDAIARLVLSELTEQDFTDPTARLVLSAIMRGHEAERRLEAEDGVEEPPPGWVEPTVVEVVIEALGSAGLLEKAGGAEVIAALVVDRPALREAREAGRAAVDAIGPVEDEAMVLVAAALLG